MYLNKLYLRIKIVGKTIPNHIGSTIFRFPFNFETIYWIILRNKFILYIAYINI